MRTALLLPLLLLAAHPAGAQEALPSHRLTTPAPASGAPERCSEEIGLRARLGATLFAEKRLSGDGSNACATCHLPELDFSDGKQRALGLNGQPLRRHTPSLVNVGHAASLFWDGRAATLEAQIEAVLESPEEMASSPARAARALAGDPFYRDAFAAAFGADEIRARDLVAALASFERSILARRSAYDRQLAGEPGALTDSAARGLALFEGKADCHKCHFGPNFTDGKFHNTGVETEDLGRIAVVRNTEFRVTPYPFFANHKAFKTPTLRNVSRTAPYFHDGSAASLADVVRFYDRGGLAADRYGRSPDVHVLGLSEGEQQDLVAFLESLASPLEYCEALEPGAFTPAAPAAPAP